MRTDKGFRGHSLLFWWGMIWIFWLAAELALGGLQCGIREVCSAQQIEWEEALLDEDLDPEDREELRREWREQWRTARAPGEPDTLLQRLSEDLWREGL